ncbi:hypothetical protein Ddye_016900, partial [Dipteronia dyeriana]
ISFSSSIGATRTTRSFGPKSTSNLSPIKAKYITALEWLVFEEIRVVAIGTSKGYLLVYGLKGDLVHRQMT